MGSDLKGIDASNVMVVCPVCGKATRVAHSVIEGKKARVCKKCTGSLDKEFVKVTKKEVKKATKKEATKKVEEVNVEEPIVKKSYAKKTDGTEKKTTTRKTTSTTKKSKETTSSSNPHILTPSERDICLFSCDRQPERLKWTPPNDYINIFPIMGITLWDSEHINELFPEKVR